MVRRYLYLNSYAILLLAAGGGILLLPLWLIHWAFIFLQLAVAYPFFKNGARILSTWDAKMREYRILMERNKDGFNPESFAKFMEAPCGRLLVKVVLHDLGYSDKYKSLKVYQKSLIHFLRHDMCTTTKTVVHVLNTDINNKPKE